MAPGAKSVIATFNCPSDPMDGINTDLDGDFGKSNYKGIGLESSTAFVFGHEGVKTRMRDLTDGTSNTALVGEATTKDSTIGGSVIDRPGGLWIGTASDIDTAAVMQLMDDVPALLINGTSPTAFSSAHIGGAQFLFGEGRVQFLSENIDALTYQYLGQKTDGKVLGEF